MDGELEPQSMRRIEALIEKDADARRYILNAVRTAARLKASLNGILSEKIPERLTRAIHSQESIKSNRFSGIQPLFRMAAAIMLILLGFGAGSLLSTGANDPITSLAVPFPADYSQVVSDAMEYNLSGNPRKWQSPEKFIITVTPVQTYRDRNGRYFREYRMEVQTAADRVQINGLAYRQNGEWKTRAVYFQ